MIELFGYFYLNHVCFHLGFLNIFLGKVVCAKEDVLWFNLVRRGNGKTLVTINVSSPWWAGRGASIKQANIVSSKFSPHSYLSTLLKTLSLNAVFSRRINPLWTLPPVEWCSADPSDRDYDIIKHKNWGKLSKIFFNIFEYYLIKILFNIFINICGQ